MTHSVFTLDPGSGNFLVLANTGAFYEYNPATDIWKLIGTNVPPFIAASEFNVIVASPISNYGATAFIAWNFNNSKVFLYKHAPGGGTTPPPTDTTPPSTPANLVAAVQSSSQINLSWSASTDNVGVAGYRVFRGGFQIATSTTTSYSDTGLSPSTNYVYTIAAYDAAGNGSSQSTLVSATTQATVINPPSTVSDFQTRCSTAGVIRCVGFDQASDIAGGYGSNSGIFPGATTPTLDAAISASGNSSLKFTIPSNSAAKYIR